MTAIEFLEGLAAWLALAAGAVVAVGGPTLVYMFNNV